MGARKPPHEYEVIVERPADFEAFWVDLMNDVAVIPLNPSMEYQPMRSTDEVDVYEIHDDRLDGVRIAGWYCVPKASYRLTHEGGTEHDRLDAWLAERFGTEPMSRFRRILA